MPFIFREMKITHMVDQWNNSIWCYILCYSCSLLNGFLHHFSMSSRVCWQAHAAIHFRGARCRTHFLVWHCTPVLLQPYFQSFRYYCGTPFRVVNTGCSWFPFSASLFHPHETGVGKLGISTQDWRQINAW